ncbi:MAG: SpoIIE family protein phosphatase [Clostridia bacterium]|nr:SpoIIE family protein phosphatase [Clostridia bacterium]
MKEIIVASLGLLLVPKKIQINVAEFFGKDLYLPVGTAHMLETASTDTIEKLNTVSETIHEMSRNYKEESKVKDNESEKLFIEALEEKLETMQENILYEDLINEDNGLTSDIFELLTENLSISKGDIINLLEKRNEYVLGFEDFDTNMKIEEDINKVVRLINDTYKIGRINNLWKQKMKENKKVISSQLDGVSRAISNVAQSIYKFGESGFETEKQEIKILAEQRDIDIADIKLEQNKNGRFQINIYISVKEDKEYEVDEIESILSKVLKTQIVLQKDFGNVQDNKNLHRQVYVSKDKFIVQIGFASETKSGSPASGDSSVQTRLDDGKYLVAISDGMGSGKEARKSSQVAVNMLSRMLSSGFDKDTSLELINSSMYINSKEDSYATLDVAILDLFAGNMEFMKNGACPTFIKNKREVNVVKSISLPARNFRPSRFSGI